MTLFFPILCLIFCAIFSFLLCGYLIQTFNKKEILAHPNARSSHKSPTPIGGGLAILSGFLLGCIALAPTYTGPASNLIILFFSLSVIAIVSFLDDVKEVSVSFRLAIHILSSAFAAYIILKNGSILLNYLPYWCEFCFITLFIAGFINLFNFMDGIDGMTSMETIFLGLSVTICFYLTGMPNKYIYLSLLLTVCTIGFSKHNWHPAKIFIGDVGSVSIGFIFAILLCTWAAAGYQLEAMILPMYYFADAGVVLLLRIINKESFWLPHNKHFFQIAVRAGATHAEIVLKVLKRNLILFVLCLVSIYGKQNHIKHLGVICLLLAMLTCFFLIRSLVKHKPSS